MDPQDMQDVTGDGPYAAGMANFAVRLVHGPGWDASRQIRDQQGRAGLAAFMDGLVDDGLIIRSSAKQPPAPCAA